MLNWNLHTARFLRVSSHARCLSVVFISAPGKFYLAVLVISLLSFAEKMPASEELDTTVLADRHKLELAMLDNPAEYLPEARQLFRQLDREKEPVAWVRACWTLAMAYTLEIPNEEELADNSFYRSQVDGCKKVAWSQRLFLEWATISAFDLQLSNSSDETEARVQRLEDLIQKVRTVGDADGEGFLLAEVAFELLSRRIVDRSLSYVIAASELVERGAAKSMLVYFQTRGVLSMSLNYRGLTDEALRIHEQSFQSYKSLNLRHAAAEVSYNSGYSLVNRDPPQDEAAKIRFLEAIRLISSTPETAIKGSALVYLSLISSRRGEVEQALELAKEAQEIFIVNNDEFWLGRSQIRLAEELINVKAYDAALLKLGEAWTRIDADAKEYRNSVNWSRYRAYKGLSDLPQAFKALEDYTEGFKEFAALREKEEYNRAAASLGLLLEKEHSRLLENERNQLLGLIVVAACMILVMIYVLIQADKVRRQKRDMQTIMDSVEEGILKIDRNGYIETGYSRYLGEILNVQQSMTGQLLLPLLFQNADISNEDKNIVENVLLSLLGENESAWEFNSGHLPKELAREGRFLLLLWTPLFNSKKEIAKIMLVVRDVTKNRQLETQLNRQKMQAEFVGTRIIEVTKIPRKTLAAFASRLHSYQMQIGQNVTGLLNAEFLRSLHTFKGEARSLGFVSLSHAIHDVESSLKQNSASTDRQLDMAPLVELCDNYVKLIDQIDSRAIPTASDASLLDTVSQPLQHLKLHLKKSGFMFGGVIIEDYLEDWDPSYNDVLQTLLIHGLTNAVDHGFLIPKTRASLVPESARFVIRASSVKQNVRIEICDNGRGIDWSFVEEKAKGLGFRPAENRPLTDVLMLDGVSSAPALTETSGRGLGLAAIRAICQKRGGQLTLLDNVDGPGSRLVVELPLQSAKVASDRQDSRSPA